MLIVKGRTNSLKKIARIMHFEAIHGCVARRSLSRGLNLVLEYGENEIFLALWRRNVAPSLDEVIVCAKHFFPNKELASYMENGREIIISCSRAEFFGRQIEFDFEDG